MEQTRTVGILEGIAVCFHFCIKTNFIKTAPWTVTAKNGVLRRIVLLMMENGDCATPR